MRHCILEPLESQDKLSQLFNLYMGQLSTKDMIAFPGESMRKDQENSCFDPQRQFRLETVYELLTLNNSLSTISWYVNQALEKLNEYETDFEYDWKHYATVKRVRSIQEDGSDKDSDYNEDGSVRFLEDIDSLKDYTIHDDLKRYFETEDNEIRGEKLGSSRPCDFDLYTSLVRRATDFSIFKIMRDFKGEELTMYRVNNAGETIPMTLGERVESEINEELANGYLADTFNLILLDGIAAAAIFSKIDPFSNEKEKYEELRFMLNRMLNLTYDLSK